MNKNYFNIAGEFKIILRFFIFGLLISTAAFAQPKTNLDIFYGLVDSAGNKLFAELKGTTSEINLVMELGTYYNVFENTLVSKITSQGIKVYRGSEKNNSAKVNFVMDNAIVTYGEPERKSLLGSFYSTRKLEISGNYVYAANSNSAFSEQKKYNFAFIDTILVEDIDKVENRSYPFTQGILPSEPFISSLFEPVIAVGAAALAVILFFSIRSK